MQEKIPYNQEAIADRLFRLYGSLPEVTDRLFQGLSSHGTATVTVNGRPVATVTPEPGTSYVILRKLK